MTNKPLLEIRGLGKAFPAVQALDNVDFVLRHGEIHALMGENGAGKSTLIKVLTGLHPRDSGEILFEGRPFVVTSPREAAERGISTVYQEINLIPYLSVAENIFLGRQPGLPGRVDWKKMNAGAARALERLDCAVDVTEPLGSFSVAVQQLVAIARALDISAKVLILDEPTSSLDVSEVNRLFAVVRKLKEAGIGILFVTHFLDQVYQISDRITVLRNGSLVGVFETSRLPRLELIANMLGKALSEVERITENGTVRAGGASPQIMYGATGLGRKGAVHPFDISVRRGEVLGLAGLLGSGRTEVARLVYGVDRPDHGDVEVLGRSVRIGSPMKAAALGFGFCPEDRKSDGILANLSVRENIVIAFQAQKKRGRLTIKKQEELARKYVDALDIKTPSLDQPVKNLSGGNQQKIIIARWLAANPLFLILDEPTRGIDVGAKVEIQKLIRRLSGEGMAILFISSELEEITRCADRVMILRDRHKVEEVTGENIDVHRIMQIIAHEEKPCQP